MNFHFSPLLAAADHNVIYLWAFILALVAIRTIGRTRRDRYWADTARAAIDKGQPIPAAPPYYRDGSWLRGPLGWTRGLIWIAVGVAFYLIPEHNLRDWAPLPICVGVAMLLIGVITGIAGRSRADRPPGA